MTVVNFNISVQFPPCIASSYNLHPVICWTTTSLRADPVDVLTVVLDVAGLAVDAVGSVDDELHVTIFIRLVLVHTSRAEPGMGRNINDVYFR